MQAYEQRFTLLFQQYRERVYRTALYVVKDAHLAQDVTQETFLRAYRHIHSVRNDGKEGAWLSAIATHAAIDTIRKRNCWNGIPMENSALTLLGGSTSASGVEDDVCRRMEAERLFVAIGKMKREYRDVLVLKLQRGLRDGEIASLLCVSEGTVKSRIHRAKRMLRSSVEDLKPA